MKAIELTDGYKLDHRRQYPKGTEFVYSNWTPRSNKFFPEATDGVVVIGVQYLIKEYLIKQFNDSFFNKPKEEAVGSFERRINNYLGKNSVGRKHIEELHDLGYLPIKIKSLPEGSICPIRVPMITVINTDPRFFWITNYLETLFSSVLWLPMTSATTARCYMKELNRHAELVGMSKDAIKFLCHDFSMRGMAGIEAAILSAIGHLSIFDGSETIPAISAIEEYYNTNSDEELIASTVAASEHSVMCAGGNGEDEFETFKRFITEIYPSGYVSIVSDTWDLWKVVTDYIPRLKNEILNREGRIIIRPDSGVPEDIICGLSPERINEMSFSDISYYKNEIKGVYEILWDTFGGTENSKGYKELDSHIGVIYGDSITLERQKEIYSRLESKGFTASNLVLGIGSYTYQFRTRDSLGFAMKSTWCQINGEPKMIFKDPITDSGMKKSLKGLIKVGKDDEGKYYVVDCVSKNLEESGCLEVVFENGKMVKEYSFNEIRKCLEM